MKLAARFGSGTNAIAAAAGAAVLIVAGAIGFSILNRADPGDPIAEDAATTVAPVAPDQAPGSDALVPVGVDAEDPAGQAENGAATPIATSPPTLELVRVAPDGGTVIAGQAQPGAQIAVLLDGVEVMLTEADTSGDFVALLTLAPSDTPRVLGLEARAGDGSALAAEETVLIAPFAGVVVADAADVVAPGTDTASLVPEAGGPVTEAATDLAAATGTRTADETGAEVAPGAAPSTGSEEAAALTANPDPAEQMAAADAGPLAEATAPGAPVAPDAAPSGAPGGSSPVSPAASGNPAQAEAPSVVIAGPQGLRIAQGPGGTPEAQTDVRLDAISYDTEGAVTLSGRGPAATDIQVFLNNEPIQLGEIGPGGAWSLQLPDVDPGTYTLSVAGLAADGTEDSRVETPFLREDPERVAAAPAASAAGIDVITVQPGFTLWGMARETFGDGILYVQIFEENRDQIDDPHWIFPGQIFRMPDLPRREADE